MTDLARKGFVFTLDAAFAAVVLMFFLMALAFLSSELNSDSYSPLLLKKQATDILIMMDKTGELSTLNQSLVNNTVNASVQSSTFWELGVTYYNYSNGFIETGNFTVNKTSTAGAVSQNPVSAEREFLVFQDGRVKHYGIARLKLWTG